MAFLFKKKDKKPAKPTVSSEDLKKALNTAPKEFFFKSPALANDPESHEKYVIENVHITGCHGDPNHRHYGGQTARWIMTLQASLGSSSKPKFIRIDLFQDVGFKQKWQLTDNCYPVHIMFDLVGSAHSKCALEGYTFDLDVAKRTTFSHVLNLIKRKKRDRFRLDKYGRGHLHWVKAFLSDMIEEDWLETPLSLALYDKLCVVKNERFKDLIEPDAAGEFF